MRAFSKQFLLPLLVMGAALFSACQGGKEAQSGPSTELQLQAQGFLDRYNATYQKLVKASSEAQWSVNTRIIKGDSTNAKRADEASKEMAAFTGSVANIDTAKMYIAKREELTALQARQFEKILYAAGGSPQTIKPTVDSLIAAGTRQTEALYGYKFMLSKRELSPNEIDSMLKSSKDVKARQTIWEASKAIGVTLKPGLVELQKLRNASVKPLGYEDYFHYQVSDYGMKSEEMTEMMHGFIQDLWPLYRELHTYARYELAARYKQPVPTMLPAHWLPNRWGQDWGEMVEVEGLDLNAALKPKQPEWIVKTGDEFYQSMGFGALPKSFYEKSDLYPAPKSANYSKNTHASAWHMDLENDLRSLMSIEPNAEWYETVMHELGHIFYYQAYSRPEIPPVLREGANRAYHEAFGTMLGLAGMQKPMLEHLKLIPEGTKTDTMQILLKQALNYVPFIPFSAGVMTDFEHALYSEKIPQDQFNAKWWSLCQKWQGMVPPSPRTDAAGFCDAATKTHINDDPAQYYDYAMSSIIMFMVHDHIAKKILKQDPHYTKYWGSKETGDFLKTLMAPGASKDWRTVLKDELGSDLTAKLMLDYFAPLMDYLKKLNAGRTYTLNEKAGS